MKEGTECILIVGGAGYIGSHVNKELARRGYHTVVLDNLSTGHMELARWGSFERCDLADRASLARVFETYRIKAVMHFSAFALVGESVADPARYYANNVTNALNLLDAMRAHDVRKMIFSSTCAVYGVPTVVPIPETHALNPINPYGRTKLMIEWALEDYAHAYGLRYASLRYFNAAGADPEVETGEWHEPETHLIPIVLDVAAGRREHVEIFGTDYETPDGTCIRDYIHVCDLADAHIRALEMLDDPGLPRVFNLGNGRGFSVRDIINTARKVTGKEIPAVEAKRRAGDPPVLVGDARRAESVLGWKQRMADIEAIIESAWQWHRRLVTMKK